MLYPLQPKTGVLNDEYMLASQRQTDVGWEELKTNKQTRWWEINE